MRRYLPLALGMFALGLILFFPMSVLVRMAGLGELGVSARAVRGSIWHGRLEAAQIGAVELGDINARIAPLALLTGKAKLVLEGEGSVPLRAAVYASPGGFGADRLTAMLPIGNAFAPFAPASVSLEETRFAFSGNRCIRAEGQIRLRLEGAPDGVEMGRSLLGTARCDGDAVATTLTGASGMERIVLRISPDGHYGGTITVRPPDPSIGAKLMAIGFHETQVGFVAKVSGQF